MHLHVFRLFQRGALLSATTCVVLVTLLWLLGSPTALAAQTAALLQPPSL